MGAVGGRGLGVGAVWARIGGLSRLSKGVKRWRGAPSIGDLSKLSGVKKWRKASRKNTFGISLTPPTGGSADLEDKCQLATAFKLEEPGPVGWLVSVTTVISFTRQ